MCASCQIYVLTNHVPLIRSEDEQAMLDEAWHVEDNSRLGCQIQLTKKLDGLKVELAPHVEEESEDEW
jgi:2Fe-2S ferredoxin